MEYPNVSISYVKADEVPVTILFTAAHSLSEKSLLVASTSALQNVEALAQEVHLTASQWKSAVDNALPSGISPISSFYILEN